MIKIAPYLSPQILPLTFPRGNDSQHFSCVIVSVSLNDMLTLLFIFSIYYIIY